MVPVGTFITTYTISIGFVAFNAVFLCAYKASIYFIWIIFVLLDFELTKFSAMPVNGFLALVTINKGISIRGKGVLTNITFGWHNMDDGRLWVRVWVYYNGVMLQ